MKDDQWSSVEVRAVAIETGLNAIPVIGGSIAAIYTGVKQTRRENRIERFFDQLKVEIEGIKDQLINLEATNQEEIAAIVESIIDAVEENYTEDRFQYFQNCFLNTVTGNGTDDYQKTRRFVSLLSDMRDIDIHVLVTTYSLPDGEGLRQMPDSDEDAPAVNSSLNHMSSLGLLNSHLTGPLKSGVPLGEVTTFGISKYGREFVDFCLSRGAEINATPDDNENK